MAATCRAVSDGTRARILATVLGAGELCVCHVEQALGITQSRASRHLAALKGAGLVVDRRQGAWVYYRAARTADPFARLVLRMARTAAADPALQEDVARAKALRDDAKCNTGGGK
jgi:ArsR family transcriptional regulator, arsenate/arsenite/antimonite-responsive transcriptional repressor